MATFQDMTDEAVLAELGDRLARQRLDRNLTQQTLAREAGLHANTIVRLEGGESTQTRSLVRVLRVLELLDNLQTLVPAPTPSPLDQLRSSRTQRRRASGGGPPGAGDDTEWSWADDGPEPGGDA